jgi:hypothetical protein
MFIIFISITLIGVSYSYLATSLNIKGIVRGNYVTGGFNIDPSGNPNLTISLVSLDKLQEKGKYIYQYRFFIKNIGNDNYDNFQATFTYNNRITMSNIWNYTYTIDNNILSVINKNYDLLAGQSLEIGFIITSNKATLNLDTVKLEAQNTAGGVDPNKFIVVFDRTGGWGTYTYQYNVTLTNKTGIQTTYWQLDVTLPAGTSYVTGWNALFSTNANILTIKNTEYNGRIANDQSTTFGLQIATNIVNFTPSDIRIMVR